MKNRKAKKGFTIIELVIVIAVIGILAGVLIPTFSNVISEANETAAMQSAKNAYTNYLIDHATDAEKNICIKVETKDTNTSYYFHVVDGQFEAKALTASECVDSETNGSVSYVHYTVEKDATEFKGRTVGDNGVINYTTGHQHATANS